MHQNGAAAAAERASAERFGSGDHQLGVGDGELMTDRPVWTARRGMTSDGDWR